MKKTLFKLVCMVLFAHTATVAYGQANDEDEGWDMINVSIYPGVLTSDISFPKGEKHTLTYTGLGLKTELETRFHGISVMYDFAFGLWGYDDYSSNGKEAHFPMPESFGKVFSGSAMLYGGYTLFPKWRFQIPLYAGIGGEYLNGAPYHNFFLDLGAKARLKFYFTTKIAGFLGLNYTIGMSDSKRGLGKSPSEKYDMFFTKGYIDLGVSIFR